MTCSDGHRYTIHHQHQPRVKGLKANEENNYLLKQIQIQN